MAEREAVNKMDFKSANTEMLLSMKKPTRQWYIFVSFLGAVILWGFIAWMIQVFYGLGVTGINRPVMWGFYITNFVFWVGLSHSGTLVSAILRLSHANWRRPILRGAEAMTVFAILVGGMFPILHTGRPWKIYYLLPIPSSLGLWPNFKSPLPWDSIAITTYIIGSCTFLYLGMIPDLAVVRDRSNGFRKKIYSILAIGWKGSAHEWSLYSKTSTLMAALIIPVAVSVHSIVSWDFAMTLVPGWHSTIFAPYFVAGAIFSGVAAVIILIIALRKFFYLEKYLTLDHLDNMGKLLLVIALFWSYLYFADVLTIWYAHKPIEWEVFTFTGKKYGLLLGIMVIGNSLITIPSLCFKKVRRSPSAMLLISLLVNLSMFIERFLIVVPPLSHRNIPFVWGSYSPSWVEISITAAAFAGFAMLFTLFSKFLPIMAMTDIHEGTMLSSKDKFGRTTVNKIIEGE